MPFPNSCNLSDVTLVSFRTQEFRLSYTHLASSTLLLGTVPWGLVVYLVGGGAFDVMVVMPLLGVAVTLVGLLPLWILYRYEVGPEGVRGYDFWGRRVRVAWNAIDSAPIRRIGGFPYALIGSPGERTLWLPLFVDRSEALQHCVMQHVSEDHPVARAIQDVLR